MLKVQDNLPIPPITRSARRRKYPLDSMGVGEMFFVPGKEPAALGTHISKAGKTLNRTFTVRSVTMADDNGSWVPCGPDDDGATRGAGVWRTA